MSTGKQDEKPGKGVPAAGQRRPEPEKNGGERGSTDELGRRVSAGELGLDASGGEPSPEGFGPQGDDAPVRRGDPAGAPADPQSAGRSGEKPQSEPRSGDPLDSGPLDSGAAGDAKPLKLLKAAAGEADGKVGLGAALDAVGGEITPLVLGKAEQMPLPIIVEPEPAFAEASAGEGQAVEGRRGPGRPKGSRNKRTDEWVDYLLRGRRPPLLVLAETYSRPVEQLATELSITKGEAFKLQLLAAKELAPYVHQKQPLAVQVDARGVVTLVIEGGLPGGAAASGAGETTGEGKGVREEAGGVMVIEGQVIEGSGEEGGNE